MSVGLENLNRKLKSAQVPKKGHASEFRDRSLPQLRPWSTTSLARRGLSRTHFIDREASLSSEWMDTATVILPSADLTRWHSDRLKRWVLENLKRYYFIGLLGHE